MKNKLLSVFIMAGVVFSFVSFAQTENISVATINNSPTTSVNTGPYAVSIIESNYLANNVLVYPNPVISTARIVLNELSTGIISVFVINMNGNIDRIYKYAQGLRILDVDMSTLPQGFYSVRVSGNGLDDYNLKVIKQ